MSKEWIDELKKLFFSPNLDDVDVPSAVDLKLKHIPQRLFKYRTFGKYSLDNLKNNTLWCCKASQFNDPYDSSFFFQYHPDTLANNHLKNAHGLYTNDEIATIKGSSDPLMTIAEIISAKSHNCPAPEKVHDILLGKNFNIEQVKQINQYIKNGPNICSLSERVDSTLMWSHYTDEHKGFVMEYDFSELDRESGLGRLVWPVIYEDRLFDASNYFEVGLNGGAASNMMGIVSSMHKAKDWEYEHEWRLILMNGFSEPAGNKPSPSVKAIYLGAKMLPRNKTRLINIAIEKKIPVYEMKLSDYEFKMEPKPIFEP
ncbi:DUF2971 domain-containing protein [Shewanella xiamenensis]|uniref:DUF2971 domain-containing protein n=1 Tax=Shewanella xiamenensis TaxID=332186 RepID=UPI00313C87E7